MQLQINYGSNFSGQNKQLQYGSGLGSAWSQLLPAGKFVHGIQEI